MKKMISGVVSFLLLLQGGTYSTAAESQTDSKYVMRDISPMQVVTDMGIGINLGNTYESYGEWIDDWGANGYPAGTVEAYETAWGSPVITQEIIQGYADAGFETLRIPVSWSNMMGENYTVSSEYITAVGEVIDWAMDCGLYVIVNLHGDGGWFENFPTDTENCLEKFTAIWTQVSTAYRDYGDHLIFEAQNEELGWSTLWNQWGSDEGKAESYDLVNKINQAFVDTVRSTGGNNSERLLMISGYNTDIKLTCDPMFKLPNDPANKMAVSVHYYVPSVFAILTEDADWGEARDTWGTEEDYAELYSYMDTAKETYVDNGIPVIVGEYGCPSENKDPESVERYLQSVCEAVYTRNMCPIIWDVPGGYYDRETYVMYDEELNALLHSVKQTDGIVGDINADGRFNIADIVALQKWLLAVPDVTLSDWKAGDLCEDDKLDVFDLCLLKRELINQ